MLFLQDSKDPVCHLDPLLLIPRIEHLGDILRVVEERGVEYSLVILDLKSFHVVNARFGYSVGDAVIKEFIRVLLSKFLPDGSFPMRFRHGDEFLFFVPADSRPSDVFRRCREWSERHNYPAVGYRTRPLTISFHYAVIPKVDFSEFPVSEKGIDGLLQEAELRLREVKPESSRRFGVPDQERTKVLRISAWQKSTSAYEYIVKLLMRFKNVLFAMLGVLTALFGVERAIGLIVPERAALLGPLTARVLDEVSALFLYYLDARFLPVLILVFILVFRLLSAKQDRDQLLLALRERSDISERLEQTKTSVPANHYLLYIHGKVGADGLEVRQRLGPVIIDSINKNIKKHEHVYWSALDEIAMIVYEVNERDESYFLRVIKKKLITEIGQEDGMYFFNSLRFCSTQVRSHDTLKDVEERTRWKLIQGVDVISGKSIASF